MGIASLRWSQFSKIKLTGPLAQHEQSLDNLLSPPDSSKYFHHQAIFINCLVECSSHKARTPNTIPHKSNLIQFLKHYPPPLLVLKALIWSIHKFILHQLAMTCLTATYKTHKLYLAGQNHGMGTPSHSHSISHYMQTRPQNPLPYFVGLKCLISLSKSTVERLYHKNCNGSTGQLNNHAFFANQLWVLNEPFPILHYFKRLNHQVELHATGT